MPLANISKIFQIVKKLWPAQKFGLEIHLRVVTKKQPVSVVILAWDTPTWPDICPTKYYQITSNSMVVMACTRFQLQETLMHDKESEELSLMQVTCLLVLHFIPKYFKYQNTSKGNLSYRAWAHKDLSTDRHESDCSIPPNLFSRGIMSTHSLRFCWEIGKKIFGYSLIMSTYWLSQNTNFRNSE